MKQSRREMETYKHIYTQTIHIHMGLESDKDRERREKRKRGRGRGEITYLVRCNLTRSIQMEGS